ncbi:hypothetical protein ACWIGW_44280 [Nocardia brasiliensis]|uniref:hypothetical protein n=1 Tax=Streptomyces sp. NPDC056056 TaxID=3345698 RepID=UPI0035E0F431
MSKKENNASRAGSVAVNNSATGHHHRQHHLRHAADWVAARHADLVQAAPRLTATAEVACYLLEQSGMDQIALPLSIASAVLHLLTDQPVLATVAALITGAQNLVRSLRTTLTRDSRTFTTKARRRPHAAPQRARHAPARRPRRRRRNRPR